MIILIIIVVALVWGYAYASGKREGSRKGYGVGFDRGKRSRGKSGCMVVLMVGGVLLTVAALASLR